MYIEALQYWRQEDWEKFFSQYHLVKTDQQKEKIKQALTLSSKEGVESFFSLFQEYGIINGI